MVNKFLGPVREVFNAENKEDAKAIDFVIKKRSSIFLSIQSQSNDRGKSRDITFIAMACVTPILEGDQLICMIVDYIGTTTKNLNDVLSGFNHPVFTGKCIGKFMLNLVEVIGWALSNETNKTSKILLKADKEKLVFINQSVFIS